MQDAPTAAVDDLIALFRTGRHAQLQSIAQGLLFHNPDDGFVWKILGASLWSQGQDAIAALQAAARLLDQDAEAHSNLGNALFEAGRLEEARSSCLRALQLRPDFAEAHSNLGNTQRAAGELEEAVTSYRRALGIRPHFDAARLNLGHVLCRLGRSQEALDSYREVLARHPSSAEAHHCVGNVLTDLTHISQAADAYFRALELRPGYAEAYSSLGRLLLSCGDIDDAIRSCHRALALNPELTSAHLTLGSALSAQGKSLEAAECFDRILDLDPDCVEAHCRLAVVLQRRSLTQRAISAWRHALELDPEHLESLLGLAATLTERGEHDDAVQLYRRAIDVAPDAPLPRCALGLLQRTWNSGREEAEATCRAALDAAPDAPLALVLSAELNADVGRFAEAEALFRRCLSLFPAFPPALTGIMRVRKMGSGDMDLLYAAQQAASQPLAPGQEAALRFGIAKFFDDLGEYEPAFVNFKRANDLLKSQGGGQRTPIDAEFVDRQIRVHTTQTSSQSCIDRNDSEISVLIVGMPRSGTTLAEQILASHSGVFGAGELQYWHRSDAALATGSSRQGEEPDLRKLGSDYLRLVRELAPRALRIVDKMPYNYYWVGLIHAALPGARFIHMNRDPIDTCLSAYFQHFDVRHGYACDLEALVAQYQEYTGLMQRWCEVLPPGVLLDVPYEGLTEDAEYWSRRMVEFLGLDWDPGCLEFHETDRVNLTASRWQVRQRIHRSSVGRWRHYEPFIGPLLKLRQIVPVPITRSRASNPM